MKFFRKYIVWSHLLLALFIGIVAAIAWLVGDWCFAGSVETWGSAHSYSFICLSIFIAAVAAINAINASTTASDTQRPFLNVVSCSVRWASTDGKQPTSINRSEINIENTGIFPADKLSAELTILKAGETNQKCLFTLRKDTHNFSIVFPSSSPTLQFEKDDGENTLEVMPPYNNKLLVKVTINYHNKFSGKSHKTILMYEAKYPESSTVMIPKDNYWD